MLIAAADGRLLRVSGSPEPGESWSLIQVHRRGAEIAILLDGGPVAVAGDLLPLCDLDLAGLAQAAAEVEWTLGAGGAEATARLDGSGRGDRILLVLDPAAGAVGSVEVFGHDGDDSITGTALAEALRGGSGHDRLEGGGGDDTLIGDAGDDLLIGGEGSDTAQFLGGTGHVVDLAVAGPQNTGSGLDHLIGIENLTAAWGADSLMGDAGANRLDGGQGVDTLVGRAGDDVYVVRQDEDVVVELAEEGEDTVIAYVSRTLEAEVEHLILAGGRALSGTGNDKANRLTGNDAANTLEGGGGDDTLAGGGGVDWLIGGSGDDLYEAEAEDAISEDEFGGLDRVRSAAGLMLLPNIEELELTGEADADGTGNDLDNLLLGNAGRNILDGRGGADTLVGGAGDDSYVWDPLDTIVEAEGEGTDTLLSDETVVLPDMLEDLVLIGIGLKDGTGNARDNRITGNEDDNLLDGAAGADTLAGGFGNDTYVVDGADTVVELADQGIDTLRSMTSLVLADHVENLELLGMAVAATGNAGDNRLTGNDAANTLDGREGSDTLIGGLGNDLYLVDPTDRIIEAAGGGWDVVRSSGSFDLPEHVEELVLIGSGADVLRGNSGANRIIGNAADNHLDGRGGVDTLNGGAGNDIYFSDGLDHIVEGAGGGRDTVLASGSIILAPWVEEVVLTGALPLTVTGNALANVIRGNAGANLLNGGGGADAMMGGAGDDFYLTDGTDMVAELDGQGTDTIWTPASLQLPVFVETLQLGGSGNITGIGNAAANLILGNAGANRLEGRGGADTMVGGAGNDVYVSDGLDWIIEAAGGGYDTVHSHVALMLPAQVEAGVLTGAAWALTGNALANRLVGNATANRIIGGAGRDTMIGGAGDDVYHGDGLDVIVEAAGAGTDTLVSMAGAVLPPGVERLVLAGAAAWGQGNAAANHITGNAAANRLDGRGGPDTLAGGAGNDVYTVRGAERIVESLAPAGGLDRVNALVSHALAPGVEELLLLGTAANGVGNDQANRLWGTAGANVLNGRGGNDALFGGAGNDRLWGASGNDQLSGGFGADRFVFARNDGRDVIMDFQNGSDRIELAGGLRMADLAITQAGQHAQVAFVGTLVVVMNTAAGALNAADFVFT